MSESSQVTIRHGVLTDLAEVQRLNQALFQYEHEAGLYPEAYNLNWPYGTKGTKFFTDCLDDTPGHVAFIAEFEGRAVGYIAGSYAIKAFRASQSPFGELDNMFVEPAHRQSGVGKRLFAAFKGWLLENNVDQLSVAAFARNESALNFYRELGLRDSAVILEMPLS